MMARAERGLFVLLADEAALRDALARLQAAGFRSLECYAPLPVEAAVRRLGGPPRTLPVLVLLAGLLGAGAGFWLQHHGMAVAYPLNVGGRPLNSWPAFGPTTIELGLLAAILMAVAGWLALCRLPRLHAPAFDAPELARATQDAFVLQVRADDPRYEPAVIRVLLAPCAPRSLTELPP